MPDFDPNAVPGLAQSVARQELVRDAAFLPVIEDIAGFPAAPLSLRRYLILQTARSPLLSTAALPSPVDLAQFLWIVSPGFDPKKRLRRLLYLRRCRKFIPQYGTDAELERAAKIINAGRQYIEDSFQDAGGQKIRQGLYQPDYYSGAAELCAVFAREFGWDDEVTLDKPLKRVFQYLKAIQHYHRPDRPLFNPSDRLIGEWLKSGAAGKRN